MAIRRKPSLKSRTGTKRKLGAGKKSTSSKSKEVKPHGPVVRGASGFEVGKHKREAQDERYEKMRATPFRFRLQKGEEAELVILDAKDLFFVTEHTLKHAGRWTNEVCIADSGVPCPLCNSLGKEGSYTLMLTVLDRRPYKIKNGPNAGKTIKISKKLLPVKGRNLDKFARNFAKFDDNFRGLKITCRRQTDTEASIGEDIEFDIKRVPERVLQKYGDEAKVADYETIFEVPTAEELCERYNLQGSGKAAGSQEFDKDDEGLDEVDGWD